MKNIVIFSLEPIETRYTIEWFTHLPAMLKNQVGANSNIIQINGDTNSGIPTHGAFLDFLSTNQWKNEQANKFFSLVKDGTIKNGDHILFTDFWNPVIIEVKYVNDLMNMNWTTHALVHAGSYDPHDFLGRLIGNKPWVRNAEKSFFEAVDHNYFATDFHINLFNEELINNGLKRENAWIEDDLEALIKSGKIVRSGWPMEYMEDTLASFKGLKKRDLIVFPHRIAPEKQVEIFRDLAARNPQFEWVVCQDKTLTKDEYHTLLGEAKVVFSASLQETLGIGCYEGCIVGALPLVPDRLSYKEMYSDALRYPSEWTESWDHYLENRTKLEDRIGSMVKSYSEWQKFISPQIDILTTKFFSATEILKKLAQ